MELIAAIRRSRSRESGRSERSAEGTNPRHVYPPQDPNENDLEDRR